MSSSLLVDANLLVLWAVGAVSPKLISRHKRLNAYVEADYKDVHLLTDDVALWVAAQTDGKTCFNFTHLREAAGITS